MKDQGVVPFHLVLAQSLIYPPKYLSHPRQSLSQQHWPRGSACVCRDSAHQYDIDCAAVSGECGCMCVIMFVYMTLCLCGIFIFEFFFNLY